MNISDEHVNKIIEMASMQDEVKGRDLTNDDITKALINIERKIYAFTANADDNTILNKNILIADDLELSVYQLTTVLKKIGLSPIVARNKEEASAEMQKVHFDCIIVDLFIPDSSDGIDLITDANNRRKEANSPMKIVVISGTDDKSLIEKCYAAGADFYIQKDTSWHMKLLKFLNAIFLDEHNAAFTSFAINDYTACFSVKRLSDTRIYDDLIKRIHSSVYSGMKNIILDLTEITTFDVDNAYIFADIYKICAENKGKLVIMNPSSNVRNALSFAFLEDIIPYANSVEQAVSIIEKISLQ